MDAATEIIAAPSAPVASFGAGAAVPIGRAIVASSEPGPAIALAGGVRFATHWLATAHLEGAILTHNPSRAGFVGLRVGFTSAPGRLSLLAAVGGGWRFYGYDLDIVKPSPSLSFLRTGPEAQVALGLAVPISRTLALTPMAQLGVGEFVTSSGCCETSTAVGPPTTFGSAYPRTTDPFGFFVVTVGVSFDAGITVRAIAAE